MLDYQNWKTEIEKEEECQYVAITAERKLKFADCIRREYFCQRSYFSRIKTEDRRRSVRSLGSGKVGSTCLSRIILDIKGSRSVKVIFFRLHVGHKNEIIRTRIPKDECTKIICTQ